VDLHFEVWLEDCGAPIGDTKNTTLECKRPRANFDECSEQYIFYYIPSFHVVD